MRIGFAVSSSHLKQPGSQPSVAPGKTKPVLKMHYFAAEKDIWLGRLPWRMKFPRGLGYFTKKVPSSELCARM